MKKIISFILTGALMCGFAATASAAQSPDPKNLVVLGDSIATGYALPGYPESQNCYAKQLANAFGLKGTSYQNLAVDGATSTDLLSKVQDSDTISAVSSADTVIISIGGNNLLQPFSAAVRQALGLKDSDSDKKMREAMKDPNAGALIQAKLSAPEMTAKFAAAVQTFTTDYASIITEIKKANPKVNLYVQTIYNPFSGVTSYETLSSFSDTILKAMNNAITSGAAAGGYSVIDVYTPFYGKSPVLTNISLFDIHPNQDGHNAIFNLAYTAITGKTYVAPSSSAPSSQTASSRNSTSTDSTPADSQNGNPKTGDSGPVIPVIITLAVVCCAGIAATAKRKK